MELYVTTQITCISQKTLDSTKYFFTKRNSEQNWSTHKLLGKERLQMRFVSEKKKKKKKRNMYFKMASFADRWGTVSSTQAHHMLLTTPC